MQRDGENPDSSGVAVGQGEGEEEPGEAGRGRAVQGLEGQASTLKLPGKDLQQENHDLVCFLERSF